MKYIIQTPYYKFLAFATISLYDCSFMGRKYQLSGIVPSKLKSTLQICNVLQKHQ